MSLLLLWNAVKAVVVVPPPPVAVAPPAVVLAPVPVAPILPAPPLPITGSAEGGGGGGGLPQYQIRLLAEADESLEEDTPPASVEPPVPVKAKRRRRRVELWPLSGNIAGDLAQAEQVRRQEASESPDSPDSLAVDRLLQDVEQTISQVQHEIAQREALAAWEAEQALDEEEAILALVLS